MDEESEDIIVSPSSPLPRKASRRLQKPQICILSLALFQVKCGDSSQDVSRKWNGCWDSSGRLALYCPRVGGGIRKRSIGEDGQPCCQLNHQVVRNIGDFLREGFKNPSHGYGPYSVFWAKNAVFGGKFVEFHPLLFLLSFPVR